MIKKAGSHSAGIGYILWLFGFTGAHRFYFGKPISGAIWFFTFGLFGIGWIIDLFLIQQMDKQADSLYYPGRIDYNLTWILLTFGGYLGLHRFYLEKYLSGILYALTGGIFGVGWIYDFCTLNSQIHEQNIKG